MESPTEERAARSTLLLGALFAATGVALGAFGAHALEPRVTAEMAEIFETGVRYQMYHGLALLALAAVPSALLSASRLRITTRWLAIGVLIFSGTLYLIPLTGVRMLGAVTPIGGVSLLIGWGYLAWGWLRR